MKISARLPAKRSQDIVLGGSGILHEHGLEDRRSEKPSALIA